MTTRCITLLAVCLLSGCSKPVEAPPKEVLRIGWVQSMGTAPALIAQRAGYFRDEELEVELKSFSDGPLIQQALAAGQLDAAYVGGMPVLQWAQRGFDARILAKVNTGHAALIARTDAHIQSLEDLKGKHVASPSRGSGMDVLLRGFVLEEQAGLAPDRDVTIVNMPAANMPQAMNAGGVEAAFSWEPFTSQAALRGDANVLLDSRQALPEHPWYVVAAPMRTLEARPNDMVRLLRAHRRAVAFLREKRDEADAMIIDGLELQPVQRSDGHSISAAEIVREARKRVSWSDELSERDIAFFQRMVGWSQHLGYMAEATPVTALIDRSFAAKAHP